MVEKSEKNYPKWKALRRTFEAKKHPKGSVKRKKLNRSALTSEYQPSYKFIVYHGKQPFDNTFRTKKEAEKWIPKGKEHEKKTKGLSIKEMAKRGLI